MIILIIWTKILRKKDKIQVQATSVMMSVVAMTQAKAKDKEEENSRETEHLEILIHRTSGLLTWISLMGINLLANQ